MESCHPSGDRRLPINEDPRFKDELLASTALLQPKECTTGPLRLLDLPSEILLLILEELQVESDLYTVALLSRRFHHLALPIYLARHGMSPFTGELILFDERSNEVLQALSIALFKPALKRIYCTFNFWRSRSQLLRNARTLIRLLSGLSYLEEAHLDFVHTADLGSDESAADRSTFNWYKNTLFSGSSSMEWAKEFHELFDTIIGTGCVTLTVCLGGSNWFIPSTLGDLASTIGHEWGSFIYRALPHSQITYQLASWVRHITQQPGHIAGLLTNQVAKAKCAPLNTFNLHSSMLLHAQFCAQTIKILNSSEISTLSLKNLNVHPDAWSIILSHIVLPNLSTLSIDMCSITHTDLMEFLQRHPHITYLSLGRRPLVSLSKFQLPKGVLDHLTRLSAPPDYLIRLLSSEGSLSSLRAVSIKLRVPYGHHFDFAVMNNILLPISHRLLLLELSLELSFESSSDDWMLLDVLQDRRPEATMPRVSKLHIMVGMYRLPQSIIRSLPRWLALFPGLKEVLFSSLSKNGPTELYERSAFIQSITKRCPGVKSIGINNTIHDVETWPQFA